MEPIPLPRLILTRPQAQAQGWVRALEQLGVQARALPLIAIAAVEDPRPLRQAWTDLPTQALAMFVSANAVAHFMAERPAAMVWPSAVLAGSTGRGTTAALREAGVPDSAIVAPAEGEPQESESLWRRLAMRPWLGRTAVILRGQAGRDWLAERLRDAGAEVRFLMVYRRTAPQPDAAALALLGAALREPQAWCWHFSSVEALAHLARLRPGADWRAARALATHPRIAAAARAAGFGRVDEAPPGPQGAAQALRILEDARRVRPSAPTISR